jgi:hypothetical protein
MKFVPERWLGDERYAEDDREAFHPFSLGVCGCLGKVCCTPSISLCFDEAKSQIESCLRRGAFHHRPHIVEL